MTHDLPTPACRYGYPQGQVAAILGPRLGDFGRWLSGQTMSGCDGREYDYEASDYRDTGCGPHGIVVHESDLRRFLSGRRPLD